MKYYTTGELIEKFKVSRSCLMNWIHTGKLKSIRLGGHYRVTETDLSDFLGGIDPETGEEASFKKAQFLNDQRYHSRKKNRKAESAAEKNLD